MPKTAGGRSIGPLSCASWREPLVYKDGGVITHPTSTQLAINGRTSLPMLELQRPQAVAHPFVSIRKDSWGLGDPKVGLPSAKYSPNSLHWSPCFARPRVGLAYGRAPSRASRFRMRRAAWLSVLERPKNEKPRNFRSVARATAL